MRQIGPHGELMIGIYGANGFIGQHLVRRLAEKGLDVRAVSRRFDPDILERRSANVDFVEADLRDPLTMGSSLGGIETVVQLISTSSPGLQNGYAVADIRDNIIPHVEFIQGAINSGVRKFIFLSSGGTVYGPGAATPIAEDAPTNPISSHGLTKLVIEKYLQMHGHVDGLNFVILRLANPFGPGQHFRKNQGLIPAVMGRYLRSEPVRIIGDGKARRDYVFIDDVIDAIEFAIRADVRQQIINIGGGESRSILDVIEAMEGVLGVSFKRDHVGERKTDVDINQLDITRARALLNWTPKTSFTEALQRTLPTYVATKEPSPG